MRYGVGEIALWLQRFDPRHELHAARVTSIANGLFPDESARAIVTESLVRHWLAKWIEPSAARGAEDA